MRDRHGHVGWGNLKRLGWLFLGGEPETHWNPSIDVFPGPGFPGEAGKHPCQGWPAWFSDLLFLSSSNRFYSPMENICSRSCLEKVWKAIRVSVAVMPSRAENFTVIVSAICSLLWTRTIATKSYLPATEYTSETSFMSTRLCETLRMCLRSTFSITSAVTMFPQMLKIFDRFSIRSDKNHYNRPLHDGKELSIQVPKNILGSHSFQ